MDSVSQGGSVEQSTPARYRVAWWGVWSSTWTYTLIGPVLLIGPEYVEIMSTATRALTSDHINKYNINCTITPTARLAEYIGPQYNMMWFLRCREVEITGEVTGHAPIPELIVGVTQNGETVN